MFAASVFIAMVIFLCISFDLQKERTKERKKEPFSVIESYFLRENIEP